jgi:hypothetical protein
MAYDSFCASGHDVEHGDAAKLRELDHGLLVGDGASL